MRPQAKTSRMIALLIAGTLIGAIVGTASEHWGVKNVKKVLTSETVSHRPFLPSPPGPKRAVPLPRKAG